MPFSNASEVSATSKTATPFKSSGKFNCVLVSAFIVSNFIPSFTDSLIFSGALAAGTIFSFSAASRLPRVTFIVFELPSLKIITSTTFPTSAFPTIVTNPRVSSTSTPSKERITSPDKIPASAPGPSGTPLTNAPDTFSKPRASAMSLSMS